MDFTNLKRLMQTFTNQGPAGCAVSISKNGETIFEHYEGYADVENQRPMGPDTIFRLYSNTKVFTAVAAMILYERGIYLLDDPVAEYLPEFKHLNVLQSDRHGSAYIRPAKETMRVRDTFINSTGLTFPGDVNYTSVKIGEMMSRLAANGAYTMEDLMKLIAAEVPLLFEPGSSFCYGMSIDLLGRLIEVWSGKTLGQFFRSEIFEPLGLTDTTFFYQGDQRERLAKVYYREDGQLKLYDNPLDSVYEPSMRYEHGGGGLLSSLRDFTAFGEMLAMGGTSKGVRILNRRTIDLMRQNQLTPAQLKAFQTTHTARWSQMSGFGYGLGVRMILDQAKAGALTNSEFGWFGMAGTYAAYDPVEQLSIQYMHQILPNDVNLDAYCNTRFRNVAYAALD